ncbi:MAG: PEGA domain-containing protein [Spirochaetaceae bacterium]
MKLFKRLLLLIALLIFLTSCVTNTRVSFESNVDGVELLIDGESYGTTPTSINMGNGIWEEPVIVLKKEGYIDKHSSIKKEVKPVNLILGIILWWPSLLWSYGPGAYQYFTMTPQ